MNSRMEAMELELHKMKNAYNYLEQNHTTITCQVRYLSEELKNKNS